MSYDDENIFAKILRGEMPCHKVYENESRVLLISMVNFSEYFKEMIGSRIGQ